jgi:hypothetical protein
MDERNIDQVVIVIKCFSMSFQRRLESSYPINPSYKSSIWT